MELFSQISQYKLVSGTNLWYNKVTQLMIVVLVKCCKNGQLFLGMLLFLQFSPIACGREGVFYGNGAFWCIVIVKPQN